MDDEVEVLAGVDVGLDVPLEDGPGVAPAGSVLAGQAANGTLRDGADRARGRSSGPGAPGARGERPEAIERIPV